MPHDFSRLYRELGLQPDCSLDAFQHAYRVLVSRQHPDRPAAQRDGAGQLALSELIVLHEQALQFHREHGRLPGAPLPAPVGQRAVHAGMREVAVNDGGVDTANRTADDAAPAARGSMRQASLAAGALVLIAIGVSQPHAPSRSADGVETVSTDAPDADRAAPSALAIGMDPATAREIQGDPLRIRDGDWEYGPSWLRFERGALVDWYSSPLRPLKVPDERAPARPDAPRGG